MTGMGILIFYSTTLLKKMGEAGTLSLDPKVGSCILGITFFIGSLISPLPMKILSIKKMFIVGHIFCGICLFLIGAF